MAARICSRPDTILKLGAIARRDAAKSTRRPRTRSPRAVGIDPALAHRIYPRLVDKLTREPVEDFRIDFEDGFGNRPDDEEDRFAVDAARHVAAAAADGALPPGIGIRIKPLGEELKRRSLRTLDLFVTSLLDATGGTLPPNFVVTLPKVTTPGAGGGAGGRLRRPRSRAADSPRVAPSRADGRDDAVDLRRRRHDRTAAADRGRPRPDRRRALRHLRLHGGRQHHGGAPAHGRIRPATSRSTSCRWRSPARGSGCPTARPTSCRSGRIAPRPARPLTAAERDENIAAVHRAWRLHAAHVRHSLVTGFYQGWDLHPAQLPSRYAAVYAFFLEGLEAASDRLRNFVKQAAQATLVGDVFDDAATGQGLLNYFLRAMNCGAISEDEAVERSGLTLDELRGRSFVKILNHR